MGSVCSIPIPCCWAAEQSVRIPQPEANNEVMQSLHDEEQHQQQLLQQGLSEIEAETTQVDELRNDSSQETEKSFSQEQVATTEVMQSLQDEERQQKQLLQQGLSEIEAETTEEDELRSDSSQETEKSSRQEQVDTIEVIQCFQDEERQQQQLLQQGLSENEAETTEVDELRSDSSRELSETESETTEVDELRSDSSQETEISPSQEQVASFPEDLLALKHDAIAGMESLLQEVCHCLLDEQVKILGIHGLRGVGKTTSMTIVYHKFRSTPNDFDVVIWVTVPQARRLARIQADMWKQLGVYDRQWENKNSHEKATDIFNVLSKKRFLLFLDEASHRFEAEVSHRFDLTEVGIPIQRSEKGSKIVLITNNYIIVREKDVDKQIEVPVLTKMDAWKLFKKKVGEELLCLDPSMPRIAKDMVKKCGGLPLMLNVFAHFMAKQKTIQEWRKARRRMTSVDIHLFILVSSYVNLPNKRVKSCFLYCVLFPTEFKILKDDLVSYWMCESFWEDYDSGVDVADNEGYQIIDTLVDACLLEDKGNYVTMHPLIWSSALYMASDMGLENLFSKAGSQLVEAPKVGKWRVNRMSLFDTNIRNLPEAPKCPNLRTLFLCHNPRIAMINDGFFQHMPALTVLDLSNTSINELPLEISNLVSLQHLNISHTWIEQLPDEVRFLSRLKCLKLEYNDLLRFISRQVISSLPMLQILKFFSCGVSLVYSEDNMLFYNNEHVDELQGLEHLKTLSITITSSRALQSLCNIPKSRTCTKTLSLKCFWGTTSLDISLLTDMKDLEMLEIYQIDSLEELKVDFRAKETEIQEFDNLHNSAIPRERSFNSLKEVTVEKCFHLRELTWVILAPNLRVLKVVDCKEMEEIISILKLDVVLNVIGNPFFNLEVIVLKKLPKLKSIYCSALSFPCLEKIKIIDCPLLKKLPLNSSSAMGKVVLFHAEERWWSGIDWQDDATRIAFLGSFIEVL